MAKDEQQYKKLVTGEEATYKQFFKTLKAGTSGTDAPVKKMFITGVSPLAMFDVTSGYNIGTNITTDSTFNDILGVTQEEVLKLLEHYGLTEKQDTLLARMEEWYNGYKFSRGLNYTIYNTDMILYYVNSWIQQNREPEELIDVNVRSDYAKIRFLMRTDKRLNGNFSAIQELLSTGRVSVSKIADSFSAFEIRDRNNFVSLLFYLGLITIQQYELGLLTLRIPNQTVQKILAEFMQKALEEQGVFPIRLDLFNLQMQELAYFQKLTVFDYLASQLEQHSKIRDYISGESFIKGFLVAYLSLNTYYEVLTEMERGKGFVDIFLKPIHADIPFSVGIELKYIKRNEFTPELLKNKTSEAVAQLERYQLAENTVPVVLVFNGWELVKVVDARGNDE